MCGMECLDVQWEDKDDPLFFLDWFEYKTEGVN